MTLSVNSSHPLASRLIEAIGIDGDAPVSLKTARSITLDTGASVVSGTYGKGLSTLASDYTRKGAVISPVIATDTTAAPVFTTVLVLNALSGTAGGNRAFFGGSGLNGVFYLASKADGRVEAVGTNGNVLTGATVVTGAPHSIAVVRNGTTNSTLYVDGVLDATDGALSYNSSSRYFDSLGGVQGQGSGTASFVWLFLFSGALTAAELLDLHQSLGAGNTMTANGKTALIANSGSSGTPTVTSVTVSPAAPSVAGGAQQQFTATVTGTNSPAQTVTWSASAGTITGAGLFTAPAATASAQTITLTATSTVDATKSGSATVTVPASGSPTPTVTSVTVSPAAPTVAGGTTQQFSAAVTGTNSPAQTVTWSASAGTITSAGLFTAPAATASAQSITVTATSTVDGTKSGTAAVTVPAGSPSAGTFTTAPMRNASKQLLANVSVRYTWIPGGRVGAIAGITPVEGVGVTDANGQLTMTGLPAGTGFFILARWNSGVLSDHFFIQPAVVS